MLIWVCAMHCEAKPVIDYYRLQKLSGASPFDIYQGDNMTCVVSGIGKLAANAATASTAEKLKVHGSLAWINLGVAGAANTALGSAFLVNKCIDMETETPVYPGIIGQPALPTRSCLTVSRPTEDFQQEHLHDMEASGFMQAALYYSSSELVQSIKVVSDNESEKTGKNRQQTSLLIAGNMDAISQQAEQLNALNQQQLTRQLDEKVLVSFLAEAHYSETRKHQLHQLLNYLTNRDFDAETLLAECKNQQAAQVIKRLQQLSRADSRNL